MEPSTHFIILTCFMVIFSFQTTAQFGGMSNFPYGYNGLGENLGGTVGMFPGGGSRSYPPYVASYYPQYPMYGNYMCYQSIYCGGVYPNYGGYPYYGNSLSK